MMSLSWESWKEFFSEKKAGGKKDNPPVEEGGHLQGWYRPGPTDRAGRLHDTLQPGEDREEAKSKSISLIWLSWDVFYSKQMSRMSLLCI